jgi:dolichol-phosphate mannosyltransferase
MKNNTVLIALGLAQLVLALRVVKRLLSTAGGMPLQAIPSQENMDEKERLSVLIPVLNEHCRLAPCLEGLLLSGAEVSEILVVDGGSSDGTQELVLHYQQRDPRIRLLDASPIPPDWNGKSWGLQVGLDHTAPAVSWILILDADVRPTAGLVRALLARASRDRLYALSIATLQEVANAGLCLIHPALLATLVYRYGIPGSIARRTQDVQANGQCFLIHRQALQACGGFAVAAHSLCEDITLARAMVAAGYAVGFFEAGDMVSVQMYTSAGEAWRNWTRSLPMRDQFSGMHALLGWLEVLLVQSLPFPLFLTLLALGKRSHWLTLLNGWLAAVRFGILWGMARAYRDRYWTYWLSTFCDLLVAIQLGRKALQRRHIWRGRTLIRGGNK